MYSLYTEIFLWHIKNFCKCVVFDHYFNTILPSNKGSTFIIITFDLLTS